MGLGTKASGAMGKLMGRESCTTLTVTSTRVTGSMIKLTVRESTPMLTELDIKAPGETTNNTVLVLRPGQTMQFTKESTMRVRRMVQVSSLLLMGLCTGATSR